jgi:predicted RNA-binding protein with PIN domain
MPSRRKNPLSPDRARKKATKLISSRDKPRHLILDGYNCIHANPSLKKIILAHGTDGARDGLAEAVRILHDYEGWTLTIVFDGRGQATDIERPNKGINTFSYVYSPSGISADEVIEGLAAKIALRDDVVVGTADGAIRLTVQTLGARWIPPEEVWRWVKEAHESLGRALKNSH